MPKAPFEKGLSLNNIPYVRWGSSEKIIFVISGGPGNMLPKKTGMMTRMYDPFLEDYSILMVARKQGLAKGCTTEDFADDYAEMIRNELGGSVHAVLGESFGGLVVQHMAGKYRTLARRYIIAVAANRMSEEGARIDMDFALYLSRGQKVKAALRIGDAIIAPGPFRWFFKGLFSLVASSLVNSSCDTFATDIIAEADAEIHHNAEENIKKIKSDVLMICGDSDLYFPAELVRETATLNSHIRLELYEGKGHMGALNDKRFVPQILEFMES